MSKFSPLSAETRDMELAPTNSRIKGWRRNRRSARSLLPAVRAVYEVFKVVGCGVYLSGMLQNWRLSSPKCQ